MLCPVNFNKMIIINNPDALPEILAFLKKYFENVREITNSNSHLANRSQNFWTTIVFESRNVTYSIHWNYAYCTLMFGEVTNPFEKTSFKYTFTKIGINNTYPIEEMNNWNVVFWSKEIIEDFDDLPHPISPLRFPVTVSS